MNTQRVPTIPAIPITNPARRYVRARETDIRKTWEAHGFVGAGVSDPRETLARYGWREVGVRPRYLIED